jgi:hypothetical protein
MLSLPEIPFTVPYAEAPTRSPLVETLLTIFAGWGHIMSLKRAFVPSSRMS